MKYAALLSALALLLAVWALPAFGQSDYTQGQNEDIEIPRGSFASLAGEVVDVWNSGDTGHRMVVLQNNREQRFVIDLGPAEGIGDINIRRGDAIEVQGYTIRRNEQLVTLANRLMAGGETKALSWYREPAGAPVETPSFRTYEGTVQRVYGERGDTIVEIVTPEGDRLPVNIGPLEVEGVIIDSGQPIRVGGEIARIGDNVTLLAREFDTRGRTYKVVREGQVQQTETEEADASRQARRYTGTVLDERTERVRGSDENHRLALIRLPDDRRLVVDLGPARDLRDIRVGEGDSITVEGNLTRVGDRNVFVADRISTEDDSIDIDRSDMASRAERLEFEDPEATDFEAPQAAQR